MNRIEGALHAIVRTEYNIYPIFRICCLIKVTFGIDVYSLSVPF